MQSCITRLTPPGSSRELCVCHTVLAAALLRHRCSREQLPSGHTTCLVISKPTRAGPNIFKSLFPVGRERINSKQFITQAAQQVASTTLETSDQRVPSGSVSEETRRLLIMHTDCCRSLHGASIIFLLVIIFYHVSLVHF